jgi:hypothetical protein
MKAIALAMRQGNTLYWLLTDHPSATLRASLGSTSMVAAAMSSDTAELRYKAYGEVRDGVGITDKTKYRFTGQREETRPQLACVSTASPAQSVVY